MENSIWLLVGHVHLESSFMPIGVKGLSHGVYLLQAVLFQCKQKDRLGHFQSVVEIDKVLVLVNVSPGFLGDRLQRSINVVDRFDKILCEILYGKVSCHLLLALRPVLEVPVIRDRTGKFILHTQAHEIAVSEW